MSCIKILTRTKIIPQKCQQISAKESISPWKIYSICRVRARCYRLNQRKTYFKNNEGYSLLSTHRLSRGTERLCWIATPAGTPADYQFSEWLLTTSGEDNAERRHYPVECLLSLPAPRCWAAAGSSAPTQPAPYSLVRHSHSLHSPPRSALR